MATITAPTRTVPRWRHVAVAALGAATGAFATLVVPGGPALLFSWSTDGAEIIHRVHGVGFGAIMTLCIGIAFGAQLHRPERKAALVQAAVGASLAVLVALTLGGETAEAAPFAIFVAIGLAITALHPARREILTLPARRPDRRLLAFAGIGAVPLLVYAWLQAAAQRGAASTDPHAMPPHYAGMAALALAIVVLAVIAAQRASGYRLTATLAGMATIALGAVSLLNRGFVSALHPAAAIVAMLAGASFIAVAVRPQPSGRP